MSDREYIDQCIRRRAHHESFRTGDRVTVNGQAVTWRGRPVFTAGERHDHEGTITRTVTSGWPWEARVRIDGHPKRA